MRVYAMKQGEVVRFGDAAPTVVDSETGQTATVSITSDMTTLEMFVCAGILTHIAVKLIDKIWR